MSLLEVLMFGGDFLLQVAALEVATDLANSDLGRAIMIQNGTMTKMEEAMTKTAENATYAGLVLPAFLKVFGEYCIHRVLNLVILSDPLLTLKP